MKHPYKDIVEQWLSDTSTQVEILTAGGDGSHWLLTTIDSVIANKDGRYRYRVKPKQDKYEHLRQALRDGNKIEVLNYYNNKWVIPICELEFNCPVDSYRIHDPYRELKDAQEQGKRVIRIKDDGGIEECFFGRKFDFDYAGFAPEQYKIVEHDITREMPILKNDAIFYDVKVKLTKSGIDGKITSEVVND